MIVLAIVLAVFILLALMRLGLYVEYSGDGTSVLLMVGPMPVRIFPKKEKRERREIRKIRKKEKKAKKKAEEQKTKKPGGLKGFLDKLPIIIKGLGRFRRRLLIKKLTLRFISAGSDPSKAALMFGASNAAFGAILPIFENAFRIKRRDYGFSTDFEADVPSIYVNAAISLAVWEAVYVILAILPLFNKGGKSVGKDGSKDGKAPYK